MVRSANSKVAVVATALVVVAALVSHAAAFDSTVYGMDVSDPVDQATFQCLKADNLTFVVIRVSVRLWPMAMSLLAALPRDETRELPRDEIIRRNISWAKNLSARELGRGPYPVPFPMP